MSSTGDAASLVVILQLIPDKKVKLRFGMSEVAENPTGDIDGEYLIVHSSVLLLVLILAELRYVHILQCTR